MDVEAATQYVRTGGSGPAVLLLHGFGDTGDMWQPLAERLVNDHRVIVPDLRGMGLSSHPEDGYEKVAQARDLITILDRLGVERVTLITHDIGNMVGYALAAQYPARVTKWAVMDAPLPGLGTWDQQLLNPRVWHFNFRGPDVDGWSPGASGSLLDRFYNEMSANPSGIDEQPAATMRRFTRGRARSTTPSAASSPRSPRRGRQPGAIRPRREAADAGARDWWRPFLWRGDEDGARVRGDYVEGAVITNAGHWIMEERPEQAIAVITRFVDAR